MSDPTPTQATPAQPPAGAQRGGSARETLREAADSIESLNASPYLTDARMEALRCAKALRALLDAPKGSVERLCEAAAAYFRAVTGRDVAEAAECFTTQRLPSETRDFVAALAAVRASPEAVAPAVGRCTSAILDEKDEEIARATAERDAIFKTRESDRRLLKMCDEDRERLAAERDALKADLAAARAEVERVKADALSVHGRYAAAHAALDAIGAPPRENPDGVSVARSVSERIALMGKGAPPPPAPPISDRARLVYEGACRIAAADPTTEEDRTPFVTSKTVRRAEFIAKYAEVAAEILAAAEKAASGAQGAQDGAGRKGGPA